MKLLYVVKNMRLSNGVASYAMNYYRSLKEQMERFDFLVISDVGSPYYQEIEEDGNHIYLMPSYKKSPHKIIYFLNRCSSSSVLINMISMKRPSSIFLNPATFSPVQIYCRSIFNNTIY